MHAHTDEENYEELPEGAPFYTHLLAGGLAGILEHTLTYPLDNIKTRMQVVDKRIRSKYGGMGESFKAIRTTEGMRGLWRGVFSVVLGAGPSHAVFFASYEATKLLITGDPHSHNSVATSIAGAVATISADAFMNPFDVIKQRMQLPRSTCSHNHSLSSCAHHVYRKEGLQAFYLSYPTTILLNIPFHTIQFTVYEKTKNYMNPKREYDPVSHCVSGAVAGGVASAMTTPIDVVKTFLQTKGSLTDPKIKSVRGAFEAVKYIYSVDGARGFFRGIQPRVLSNMPSTAICWTTYEYFKWLLI